MRTECVAYFLIIVVFLSIPFGTSERMVVDEVSELGKSAKQTYKSRQINLRKTIYFNSVNDGILCYNGIPTQSEMLHLLLLQVSSLMVKISTDFHTEFLIVVNFLIFSLTFSRKPIFKVDEAVHFNDKILLKSQT